MAVILIARMTVIADRRWGERAFKVSAPCLPVSRSAADQALCPQ